MPLRENYNYSPWPDAGKRWRFEWRKATWMLARPWYGANNVKYELPQFTWLSPITFWFPFISYCRKFGEDGKPADFHFYYGWKPIPPVRGDAFLFTKLNMFDDSGKTLYVQLSGSQGIGTRA
jgi:hypothetical protein